MAAEAAESMTDAAIRDGFCMTIAPLLNALPL